MRLRAALAAAKEEVMTNTNLDQLPDLMAATQALAENLLASEPFAIYHQASSRFNADPQARGLIERLSQAQADLRRKQANGGVTQADVDQLRALQREVQSNDAIVDYATTQQSAIAYLREINQTISELIGTDFAALAKKSTC
jgi:cell fate (sporulation/competence/biofilm development) regulator YlbF (YheA/YmcA/DUF963 family)